MLHLFDETPPMMELSSTEFEQPHLLSFHLHCEKPKFENCEYFLSAQDALLAGYRPCKRCQPLRLSTEQSKWMERLIEAVEGEPERRWSDRDFEDLGICSSTVRRQFKKRFG